MITFGVAGGSPAERSGDPALTATSEHRAVAAEKEVSRSAARANPGAGPSETAAAQQKTPQAKAAEVPAGPPKVKAYQAPVAGLDWDQMANAAAIVQVALDMELPKRMAVIGVATAMQESNLYNIASTAVPESFNYPNQGVGSDHDSVGILQQRPSAGWGTVENLMKPAYQARTFFTRLQNIDWANMALTYAAQAVQISAYPEAYAKHEQRADEIVNALY